ncbi:hypothetical protein [Candidatus Endoriftia persephone]|jgi:hypothetical protein|uniref:Uncharacterized protein n=3 Tax=Gammaproteobacteria TaxID=1236 RepID=G2FGV9_9GAMM|nr:hypothetical protein [Candidatus Endoriftia persephone]EGV51330.1 hypothetical protein Rifp1Sym_bn00220 [endosymbiont of Riftia pachyptila (vent Ph05)]EGW53928.1 hypothetical protein TevJSym_as00210 [endosymbiont of Tevnia jerichonana (vent Tica)]USF87358.1 hypothetical protein L0Y14_14730 [Candidatus Endoriftia persephone]
MKSLLNYFVDLCLLRAAPQDLPVSSVLLALTALLNVLVGVLMIVDSSRQLGMAVLESLFEAGLMLLSLQLALRLTGLQPRFLQTASALMGSGLLMGLLALPLLSWNQASGGSEVGLLLLVLVIWSMVVLGHIIRHAFNLSLNLGIAFGFIYTLSAWSITSTLFPVVN